MVPTSPDNRGSTVVNFQAILLISSGETSSNRDIFFTDNAAKEKNFRPPNFSTRNSPSVFPYLVKLNGNGSYHGLREPIRKLENHYPELKIYLLLLLLLLPLVTAEQQKIAMVNQSKCCLTSQIFFSPSLQSPTIIPISV